MPPDTADTADTANGADTADTPAGAPATPVAFLAGYSGGGHTPEQLLSLCTSLGAFVADIRLVPRSRNPQWKRVNLSDVLGGDLLVRRSAHQQELLFEDEQGTEWTRGLGRYKWVRDLGNLNFAQRDDPIEIADLPRGLDELERVAGLLRLVPILLCVCASPEGCHRTPVGEGLRGRGWDVRELEW
jgi:hypothetical protein